MSRKKKPWAEETAKLEQFMYETGLENTTKQLSPYHFRIVTPKNQIDIWAGSKKYLIKGAKSIGTYEKVEEIKKYLV